MSENPRIEELRRRVQSDPTSIAFAALAEEYRRAGRYDEAIEVCRSGLTRHPAYISARVTLGRALLETDKLDEAAAELEQVLKIAPENLTATRALTEIAARRGAPPAAAPAAASQGAPAMGFEKDLMAGLARAGGSDADEKPPAPIAPAPAQTSTAAHPVPARTPIPVSTSLPPAAATPPEPEHAGVVERLQHFLHGIRSAKTQRSDRASR